MISDDEAEAYRDNLRPEDAPRIRRQIAMNQLDERKRALAKLWLAEQNSQEHIKITRSAKNAAWGAAIAAGIVAAVSIVSLLAEDKPPEAEGYDPLTP